MLNKEQIMEILPHRPPMLLVDEILEMDENHVVGALHLTGDEFFFQGHFPGNPIMPAVFRLEALAQAGGVALLSLPEFKGKTAVYTGIDKAKFRAMAKPGDTLRLEVTFTKRRGPMAVAEGWQELSYEQEYIEYVNNAKNQAMISYGSISMRCKCENNS